METLRYKVMVLIVLLLMLCGYAVAGQRDIYAKQEIIIYRNPVTMVKIGKVMEEQGEPGVILQIAAVLAKEAMVISKGTKGEVTDMHDSGIIQLRIPDINGFWYSMYFFWD